MPKIDLNQENDEYFDALREIGNVGANNASIALGQLLGRRVEVHASKVKLLDFKDIGSSIGGEEQIMTGIYLKVEGQINGSVLLMLKKQAASAVVGKLLGNPDRNPKEDFSELECSALSELGNIVTSSYLTAISSLTGLKALPSVPSLCVDMAGAILSVPAIEFGMMCDKLLLVENRFSGSTSGYLILVPDIDSYDRLLERLNI